MLSGNQLHTHHFGGKQAISRFNQDGKSILYRRCMRCWRDFGQGFDGVHSWEAIYVGVLRIERLARSVTERWLSEVCPSSPPPEDEAARALRWG